MKKAMAMLVKRESVSMNPWTGFETKNGMSTLHQTKKDTRLDCSRHASPSFKCVGFEIHGKPKKKLQ
jgi:hypothetical protein